jgi:hypothetical protein
MISSFIRFHINASVAKQFLQTPSFPFYALFFVVRHLPEILISDMLDSFSTKSISE